MSYILEALRKAERERRLGEAPSVPEVLSVETSRRRTWLPWMAALLMLIVNGILLGYFWLKGDRTTRTVIAREASQNPVAPASPPMPSEARQPVDRRAGEKKSPTALSIPKPQAPTPDGYQVSKPVTLPAKPSTLPGKESPGARPVATAPAKHAEPANLDRNREPPAPQPQSGKIRHTDENPATPDRQPVPLPPAASTGESTAWRRDADYEPAVNIQTPSLDEMPREIRDNMPSLRINVLAYSSVPEERFAIINMVKYNRGDRIPGGALLRDIQADGVVLELNGRRFRVSHH